MMLALVRHAATPHAYAMAIHGRQHRRAQTANMDTPQEYLQALHEMYNILYGSYRMLEEKELHWVGSCYQDLLAFPAEARREAGFQLGRVQAGLDPLDWKPLDSLGAGLREIRIRESHGSFRVIYLARLPEAVYLLHCFQKKTRAIPPHHQTIIVTRYRAILGLRTHPP